MKNEAVLQSQGGEEHPTYNRKEELTGLVTSCVGNVFQITLLKETKRYGKSKVTVRSRFGRGYGPVVRIRGDDNDNDDDNYCNKINILTYLLHGAESFLRS